MFDKLKAWQVGLAIFVLLCTISGTGYKFYECKASKSSVVEIKADLANFKLEDYRKELVRRMWAIEREFPNTYRTRMDYKQLKEELRILDLKIKAYYQRKGG